MFGSGREYTQIKRPIAPPMDLDGGRLNALQAALAGGFVLAALLLASFGGWIVIRSWAVAYLGVAIGLVLFLVGAAFGVAVLWISLGEWADHRSRVADWHNAALLAYEANGAETVEHVSEWAFSADNPAHVLIAALTVARRLSEGADAPWSVRSLQGPVFIGSRRVGSLSKLQAENMGQKFVRLGLVDGRAERVAGSWSARSPAEIVQLVWDNWN
jgi:signal transduction histidine kinase